MRGESNINFIPEFDHAYQTMVLVIGTVNKGTSAQLDFSLYLSKPHHLTHSTLHSYIGQFTHVQNEVVLLQME